MIRIAWALVNYGPIWAPAYTSHLRAIAVASRTLEIAQLGGVYACGATDRQYTHSAENQVVRDFLADESLTHLFLTESDMLLPDATIPKLIEVHQPMVSGVYFLRNGNGQPCLYKRSLALKGNPYGQSPVTLFPLNRPFELNGCTGLGCLLVERQVFENTTDPWFQLRDGSDGYGSDMYFFKQCRDAGFSVWVQPSVLCGQIDYHLETVETYRERLATDPQFAGSGFVVGMERDPWP